MKIGGTRCSLEGCTLWAALPEESSTLSLATNTARWPKTPMIRFTTNTQEWHQLLVLSAPRNLCGVRVEDPGWTLSLTNTVIKQLCSPAAPPSRADSSPRGPAPTGSACPPSALKFPIAEQLSSLLWQLMKRQAKVGS